MAERSFLSFLNEFFLALGAGDGNLTLASGHTHRLAATGAIEIAVLPVLQPLHHGQILPIFLVALVGVPGKTAEDSPEHQSVRNGRQQQIHRLPGNKHGEQTDHNTRAQDGHIQFIRSVAACHKATQTCGELCTQAAKKSADSVHCETPY